MSFQSILKQNRNQRPDIFVGTINCDAINFTGDKPPLPEGIDNLVLNNPITGNKTTITTEATEDYQWKLPETAPPETTNFLVINNLGEIDYVTPAPGGGLPPIGDIVCDSLTANDFIKAQGTNSNEKFNIRDELGVQVFNISTVTKQVSGTNFFAEEIFSNDKIVAKNKLTLLNTPLDNTTSFKNENPLQDNPTDDVIVLPLRTTPAINKYLKISSFSTVPPNNSQLIETEWANLPTPESNGTVFFIPVDPAFIISAKRIQYTINTLTFEQIGLQEGKSYRILLVDFLVRKESGGTNQDYFIFEAETTTVSDDNLTQAVAICGMGNGTINTNYKLINQNVIGDLADPTSASTAGTYTRPVELIVQNCLSTNLLKIKLGNGYCGSTGWDAWSVPQSIKGIYYEL
jgi:hypothetical protein